MKKQVRHSIATKLFFLIILLSILPMLVVGYSGVKQSSIVLKNSLSESSLGTISALGVYIDGYIDDKKSHIKNFNINKNDDLKVLVEGNEEIVAAYLLESQEEREKFSDLIPSDLYERALADKEKVVLGELGKQEGFYTLTLAQSKPEGVLVLVYDLSLFQKNLGTFHLGGNGTITVLDRNYHVIFDEDQTLLGETLNYGDDFIDAISSATTSTKEYKVNQEELMVSSFKTKNNLTVISNVPKSYFNNLNKEVNEFTLKIGIATIIIAIAFTLGIQIILRKKVEAINTPLEYMSQGDLTIRPKINSKDEFGVISNRINIMIERIRLLIRDLQKASYDVNTASTSLHLSSDHGNEAVKEIGLAIEEIASGTMSQSESLQGILLDIEGLVASIEEIQVSSDELEMVYQNSYHLSQDGQKEITLLKEHNVELQNAFNSTNHAIRNADLYMEQIGDIILMMTEIAERTNLLSLNATIEAARAGEAGQGFRVVANEIRSLADQTKEGSKQIHHMISNVQEQYKSVLLSSSHANKTLEVEAISVEKTKLIFSELFGSMETLHKEIEKVKLQTEHAKEKNNQLSEHAVSISAISEETSASTQEVLASVEEMSASMDEHLDKANDLQQIAMKLEESSNQFKV